MKLEVKYFSDEIEKLQFISEGKSDWVDLRSRERIELHKGDFKIIPLGVGIKLPAGYEAIMAPRSSAFKNYGILQVNSIGVIDESYCGNNDEWMMAVYATRDAVIEVNDRICQFRLFEHQLDLQFEEVKTLGDTNRGGFGSTGKN